MKKNKIQQNKKKPNKKIEKTSNTSEKSSINTKYNMFAFGFLDLTFIIEFNDKEISQIKDVKSFKEITIDNLELLEFIKDNQDLINRIQLQSENDSIKQFLLLNKISKGNKQIEFFPFCCPKFTNKCTFFQEIFDKVTKKYGILVNKNSLDKDKGYSINIKLIYKKSFNSIEYVEIAERESDMEIKSESPVNPNTSKKIKIEEEETNSINENPEENPWVKKGLIPKFKRKGCMLSKLRPNCEAYDLIYVNYSDLQNIQGDFEEEDFIELIKFFKKKKSKIFIDFYKPLKSEYVEPPEEEEEEDEYDDEDDIDSDDIEEKVNTENPVNEEKKESEKKESEKQESEKKEVSVGNKEEDIKDEKPKNRTKFKNQKSLNKLYKLTDLFFFDEKQAYQLFDRHLKCFSKKKSVYNLNKAQIYDYFMSSIVGKTKDSEEKIGLFLNEFEKFTVVVCSKQTGSKETMDSKLYPKKTYRNIQTINQYKQIIQENKDDYYNIFATFMLRALSSKNANIEEEINSAFIGALTIIKKEIECNKNKVHFDITKLIDYKTIQKGDRENRRNYSQKWKERGFVLDCLNQEKSTIKQYIPLKDKNLKWYFRSKSNMKYLVQKGFVDNKGYIMYDREYRRAFGSPDKLKYKYNNKSSSLSKIIKDLSMKNNLNISSNYIVTENIRTKENIPK